MPVDERDQGLQTVGREPPQGGFISVVLGLIIGMLFKYVIVGTEIGVKVFGPIHGALFVAYLVSLVWPARAERWGLSRMVVGAAAAVPSFTSVLFERWAARRRHARVPAPTS